MNIKRIFIAGCGRSGTTLLCNYMFAYNDTFVLPFEAPSDYLYRYDSFLKNKDWVRNFVVKRTYECHSTLHTLPEDIHLIYVVRHPFDCLTSYIGSSKDFHISIERWKQEFAALQSLKKNQVDRKITYVKYEDIIFNTNEIQNRIGRDLKLESKIKFEELNIVGIESKPHSLSIFKWKNNQNFKNYLIDVYSKNKEDFLKFSDIFQYNLEI